MSVSKNIFDIIFHFQIPACLQNVTVVYIEKKYKH